MPSSFWSGSISVLARARSRATVARNSTVAGSVALDGGAGASATAWRASRLSGILFMEFGGLTVISFSLAASASALAWPHGTSRPTVSKINGPPSMGPV